MDKSGSDSCNPSFGCGSGEASLPITLHITTTTGGSFSVVVDNGNSVENLKKIISKKLKVSKDRICLLHRERELHDGTLRDNGLVDGSKLILTPNVETGLLAQRAENTVMQALESLNDNQVNDFLSGKAPLNLSVRLGDHMMLIQLQLSALNPSSTQNARIKNSQRSRQSSSTNSLSRMRMASPAFKRIQAGAAIDESSDLNNYLTKKEIENIHNLVKSLTESKKIELDSLDQSPIKSLSNLVTSSINRSLMQEVPVTKKEALCFDPISANLTSCLCKQFSTQENISSCGTKCQLQNEPAASTSQASLHRTAHNPITRHKTKLQSLRNTTSFDSSTLNDDRSNTESIAASSSAPTSPARTDNEVETHENPALAAASRNLTQTLRKLSKRVFTNKDDERNVSPGAVMESMKHHGKGIYSGTFSGTLNPALQDKFGRPKRDISTIIHILNDLLSAAPQCTRAGTKIYFEPTATTSTAAATSTTITKLSSPTGGGSSPKIFSRNPSTPTSNASSQTSPNSACLTSHCTYGRCDGHPKFKNVTFYKHPKAATPNMSTPKYTIEASNCSCPTELSGDPTKDCTPLYVSNGKLPNAPQSTKASPCNCKPTTIQFHKFTLVDDVEMENRKTKSKLDSLRLIMQQKKERREARKSKCLPYTITNKNRLTTVMGSAIPSSSSSSTSLALPSTVVLANTQHPSSSSSSITIASTSDTPNHLVEEVETVA